MIRHIPPFILQNYEQNVFSGSFEGFALLFDIADFTKIGTSLQKQGKKGAEELSRFLEDIFHVPIDASERNGGFVSVFAGDAVCVLFPDGKPENVLKAVVDIRDHFREHGRFDTEFGSFDVKVRLTVTVGKIMWKIFSNDTQNEYVFFGDTISEMAELSGLKVDVMLSGEAGKAVGEDYIEKLETGFRLKDNAIGIDAEPRPLSYDYSPATVDPFVRASIRNEHPGNEIRSAAYCFANLEGVEDDQRENAIATIAHLADTYGGFVNKLDATDKGLIAILLFGLPKTEGKTLERICCFALEVTESVPDIALGISCGSVFAGYTGSGETREYTALGHPMNLSARLMSKAKAGEVLADAYLWQNLNKQYLFSALGTLNLKGIEQPLRFYRLEHRIEGALGYRENEFVGRKQELKEIRNIIEQNIADRTNAVIYISGDPGIGKTRLVREVTGTVHTGQYFVFFASCDGITQTLWMVFRQILRTYFFYNESMPKEAGAVMFSSLWIPLAGDDPEMIRIESIIASMLGYEWENSIWGMLPDKEKPSQLRNALLYFFQKLASIRPILIHLDDGQWIDASSRDFLQLLSEKQVAPVQIITSCRYLESGEKVDLKLENHRRHDFEIEGLGDSESTELVASILRIKKVPQATLELIEQKSMHNPLFIEQIAAFLQENAILNDCGEIVKETGYLSTFSINDIVGSRIDRLTEKVRECVNTASVLGAEFNIKVLTQMLSDEPSVELEEGRKSRIWRDLDELRYIFSHIMIRDIVYQRMMSDKLKKLHKLAAEAMEAVYRDDLDEHAGGIAMHYEMAEELKESINWYNIAGFHEQRKIRYCDSLTMYEKGMKLSIKHQGKHHPVTASFFILSVVFTCTKAKMIMHWTIFIKLWIFNEKNSVIGILIQPIVYTLSA